MRIGDLGREHRYRRVTYTSDTVSITGTLDYFQTLEAGAAQQHVLTIGGWVSHPLASDEVLELHA